MAHRDDGSHVSTNVSGRAHAHFGDSHVHHYYPGQPQSNKFDLLYQSLSYDGMDRRARNVEMALPKTCEWLWTHEHFLSWADPARMTEHNGFLWLKGKPGCGKSTIMKEALERARREWKDQPTLFYFFNTGALEEQELENSCQGMYRTLTYQLLTVHQSSREIFVKEFGAKERSGRVEPWTDVELQNFLRKLIKDEYLPLLNVYVDALDEGDEDDIEDLIAFFENLAAAAALAGATFRFCFSSRHYPQISIETGLCVVIESEPGHTLDIMSYIKKKLPRKDNPLMKEIRETLTRKANGIFLWVVLTISLLKPLYTRGRVETLRKELDSIPLGIHNLFSNIISRRADDIQECITLLQWMLVSKRALSALELHLTTKQHLDTDEFQSKDIDEETVRVCILDRSMGLVELTSKPTSEVYFIHESVRQFLNREGVIDKPRLPQPFSDTFDFQLFHPETCHATAAETCLKYLSRLYKERRAPEEFSKNFGLAQYAATFWWQHVQAASDKCTNLVIELAGSLLTLKVHGTELLQRTQVSAAGTDTDVPVRPPGTALEMAAAYGHDGLVRALVKEGVDVDAAGGNYGTPLIAASQGGHENVVRILLKHGAAVNKLGKFHDAFEGGFWTTRQGQILEVSAIHVAIYKSRLGVARLLLEYRAGTDDLGKYLDHYQEPLEGNVLQMACHKGEEEIVRKLLDNGVDINTQGGDMGTPLQTAIASAHCPRADHNSLLAIVQILLERGADVNDSGGLRSKALVMASCLPFGGKEMVTMLLESGAQMSEPGHFDFGPGLWLDASPLQSAVFSGNTEIAKLLLEQDSDGKMLDSHYKEARDAASSSRSEERVRLVLDKCPKPLFEGHFIDMSEFAKEMLAKQH